MIDIGRMVDDILVGLGVSDVMLLSSLSLPRCISSLDAAQTL